MWLVLGADVKDEFIIPETGSVDEVTVRGWRGTLESGFRNAYPVAGASGRKLELLTAELSFAPAVLSLRGTLAVLAQIRFKARLLDKSGTELGALAGLVEAREVNTVSTVTSLTDNAAKAVEALYEKLNVDLATKN